MALAEIHNTATPTNSDVLINKLGVTDEAGLEAAEVELTQARLDQFEPDFHDISLSTLRDIRRHRFQNIYHWAGELCTVDSNKGNTRFANANRIETRSGKALQKATAGKLVTQQDPS